MIFCLYLGRGGSNPQTQQQQQQAHLVKQLEIGVGMNNIHPHILHLPLVEPNLRSIHQLISLQTQYQHQNDALIQVKELGARLGEGAGLGARLGEGGRVRGKIWGGGQG